MHQSDKDLALAQAKINIDLMNVDQWLPQNRMIANVKKTKSLVTGSKSAIKKAGKLEVRLSDETVEQVDSFNYLGLRVSNCLSWESCITIICRRTHMTKLLRYI